jgi:hypothetical protein
LDSQAGIILPVGEGVNGAPCGDRVAALSESIAAQCYAHAMTEERPGEQSRVDECVASLKRKIPPEEHGALESRVDELLNDPSADENEVISILIQEFDPQQK